MKSGLDPESRRQLWDVILNAKKGKCIILTTHSLEEADVLCDRIGIMSKGKLKCLGSSLHLKNKFGSGFKLRINYSQKEKALEYIHELFGQDAKPLVEFSGTTTFEIKKGNVKISQIFKELEQNKSKYGINDWEMAQTTLEDVFLEIVRRDEETS